MFGRRKVRLPELAQVQMPELLEVRLPDVRLPVPEVRLAEVQLPSVPELRLPSVELGGLRTPALEIGGRAPFVHRRRSNPLWVGLKFALGLSLGLAVGCLVAALLAPSAGDETRRMLRQRVPGGGVEPHLPDEAR